MLEAARKSLYNSKDEKLEPIKDKEDFDWKTICIERLGFDPDLCPKCKKKTMVELIFWERGRDPPSLEQAKEKLKTIMKKTNKK